LRRSRYWEERERVEKKARRKKGRREDGKMRKKKNGVEKGKWGDRGLSELVLGQNGERS
jgi:hypothetical protein